VACILQWHRDTEPYRNVGVVGVLLWLGKPENSYVCPVYIVGGDHGTLLGRLPVATPWIDLGLISSDNRKSGNLLSRQYFIQLKVTKTLE
jgi:hypothetical protein